MSFASLLLAFAPALAARFKPEKQPVDRELELASLRRELDDAHDEARRWRERSMSQYQPLPLGGQHAQQAQYQQAQQAQQLAQYQQYLGGLQNLAGLQQAQCMEMYASCTPSRRAALTGAWHKKGPLEAGLI